MTDELEKVMAALRAAGWRSSEERLRQTAFRRLTTARWHRQQAAYYRELAAQVCDRFPEAGAHYVVMALRHSVREAERSGQLDRPARDAALRMAPSWTAGFEQLLLAAAAVVQPSSTSSSEMPGLRADQHTQRS